MDKKIRVVILCHFTDQEIQSHLPLRKPVREFAPWIVSTLRELAKYDEIEIHLVSPHAHLKRNTSFASGNVHYHFFATGMPFFHRNWPGFFQWDLWTNFRANRRKIKDIIHRISPDIIHLYGAENAYYATAFLDHLNHPHLVTIQGFLYLVEGQKKNPVIFRRIAIEKEIYSKTKNFGIRYSYMEDELKKLNPNANYYWHHIPANIYIPGRIEKTYDVVYFAKLSKAKGIEDFIKVIGRIKRRYPEICAKVLGPATPEYMRFLKELTIAEGCSGNIEFKGFIPTQKELHSMVSEAKICLLPVYFDTIPGTIVESMFLKTAVVSYKTGGIPTLNESVKAVELVEKGDIQGLADRVLYLLTNEISRINQVETAKKLAEETFSAKKAIANQIKAYNSIVSQKNIE
jgi:glycosyltransferase involved in cell wall biosynthesis